MPPVSDTQSPSSADGVGSPAVSTVDTSAVDRSHPEGRLRKTTPFLVVVALMAIVGLGDRRTGATVSAVSADILKGATVTEQADRIGSIAGIPPAVPLPADAQPVDTANPDRVVGTGTAASCTSAAVIAAVASGGIITFDCGPKPHTIVMDATAKVVNTSQKVVIDGGSKITLDGNNQHRILYMNTCDPAQVWTTPQCDNQMLPNLTVQNLTFTRGNSTEQVFDGGGGGAVFVRGGRVRIINSTFTDNRCEASGPDVGGGALRVLSQYNGVPVIVATSSFTRNSCSNGGALSSIGQSWQVYNSTFVQNTAIGNGANPARQGLPGGGNGGAMYFDGNKFDVDIAGAVISDNRANEGGGAVFFVSNNLTGHLTINQSTLERNASLGFETAGYPGIFYLGQGPLQITNTIIK